jgi:hypothetical protein
VLSVPEAVKQVEAKVETKVEAAKVEAAKVEAKVDAVAAPNIPAPVEAQPAAPAAKPAQ